MPTSVPHRDNKMGLKKPLPLIVLVMCLAGAGSALAQGGAVVNGAVGVVSADGSTDFLISGGIGYRFNRALGFGIEFTHVPDLERESLAIPLAAVRLCCPGLDRDLEGHATIFTTNVRVEIPTTLHRLVPFVVGGGGIASVTEEIPIYYALPYAQLASLGLTIPTPNILPGPQNYSTTTLAMALTLGGGASVLLTDHLSIDADLRVVKLLANEGRTMGRYQVGAGYRF